MIKQPLGFDLSFISNLLLLCDILFQILQLFERELLSDRLQLYPGEEEIHLSSELVFGLFSWKYILNGQTMGFLTKWQFYKHHSQIPSLVPLFPSLDRTLDKV